MKKTQENTAKPHSIEDFWQGISHIGEFYVAWAKKKGINYNTLAIFHTLVGFTHCTQKQICQAWALPKQTVSMACQKLSADGLIAYLPAENDKREKQLVLTEQGKQIAIPIITELTQIELQILNQFGNERMADFLNEFNELKQIFIQQFGEK